MALDAATIGKPLALNGPVLAAFRKRVAAQLRIVADLHGADADEIARAESELEPKFWMLVEADQEP